MANDALFSFFFLTEMPTEKELIDFLEGLTPIPQELIDSLKQKPKSTIACWMSCTEAQWKEFYGLNGIFIYNYLHPERPPLVAGID